MGYSLPSPSMKLSKVTKNSKKCGNFYKVAAEALAERNGLDPDIDSSKTYLNEYKTDIHTAEELMEYSDNHCDAIRDRSGRKLRNDCVRMIATVLKPPGDMMFDMPMKQQKQFLNDAYEIFGELIGEKRIKAAVTHFDEQVPHIHIFWEPMTDDGFLCAKEVFDANLLHKINSKMPEKLRERGWNIDDCNFRDFYAEREEIKRRVADYKKEHTDTEKTDAELYKHFQKEIDKERKAKNGKSSAQYKKEQKMKLEKEIADLENKKQELTENTAVLNKEVTDLEERKKYLTGKETKSLGETIKEWSGKEKQYFPIRSKEQADRYVNGEMEYDRLKSWEKVLSDKEQSLNYKESEIKVTILQEVEKRLPEREKEISQIAGKLSLENKELRKQLKEKETIIDKLRHLIEMLLRFIFRDLISTRYEQMPKHFIFNGYDYSGMDYFEAATEMVNRSINDVRDEIDDSAKESMEQLIR